MTDSDKDKTPESPLRPQVIDLTAEEISEAKSPEAEALASDPKPSDADSESDKPFDNDMPGPADTAELPPPPRAKPRNWRIGAGVAALIAALLIGAWLYKNYGQRFWPSDAILALQQQSASLAATDKTLGEQVAGLGAAVDTLKADNAKLTELVNGAGAALKQSQDALGALQSQDAAADERLGKLESALADINAAIASLKSSAGSATSTTDTAPQPDLAGLAALEIRVAALEKAVNDLKAEKGNDNNTTALLSQALSDLKAKIAAGASFNDEFTHIARIVPAAPGLDVLERHAAAGIANAQGLARELTALAPSLPAPPSQPAPSAEPGYWDWFVAELGSVVTIRRLGEPDWRDVATRAAAQAEAGDLTQAVTLIETTEGNLPAALAEWRNEAKARLGVEAALEQVSGAVLRQIAAMGGAP